MRAILMFQWEVMDKVSTNHNLSEEKGEPKRYRTEVLPLTSLTPYRWAKPALYHREASLLYSRGQPTVALTVHQEYKGNNLHDQGRNPTTRLRPRNYHAPLMQFAHRFQCKKWLLATFSNRARALVVDLLPNKTTMTSHHYTGTVLAKVVAAVQEQGPNMGTSRTVCSSLTVMLLSI